MNVKNVRKVKAFLVANGITQAQIAKDMGLARPTINRWISGYVQSQRIPIKARKAVPIPAMGDQLK